MTNPSATFPNETYLNGLRTADATVVDAIYNEFRLPVAKEVQALGGSYADGNTFFRLAIIHASLLLQKGEYPDDASIFLVLKNLAVSHYRDWLSEKGQELPLPIELGEEERSIQHAIPVEEDLRNLRKQIRAKRQYTKLSLDDQRQILGLANQSIGIETGTQNKEFKTAFQPIERYKVLLDEKGKEWETPLPGWVIFPLTDSHFNQIWSACEALERRLYSSQVPASNENKSIRNAFILLVLFTIGFAAYTWIFRDRTPAKIYDQNFQPPVSILEDMAKRYAKDSIAPIRPEACSLCFSRADSYYKKQEWREAAAELVPMLDDSLAFCQSDAYYYLAIIGLQLNDPELTLEFISKIEDLDRFGEEIYWYMALAYVKIAALDPSEKDNAKRAVQRALSNTEIPARREQAEKMLEELSEPKAK